MKEKMNELKEKSVSKAVDIDVEEKTTKELQQEIAAGQRYRKELSAKLKDLKLYNFKLSKACHDLTKTVTGKSSGLNKSQSRGNKSLRTSRIEKSDGNKSLLKSKSLKKLLTKRS